MPRSFAFTLKPVLIFTTNLTLACHAAVHSIAAGADLNDQLDAGMPRGSAFACRKLGADLNAHLDSGMPRGCAFTLQPVLI